MSVGNSLCVALDGSDRDWIISTARALGSEVGWLKIGLEAFIANGPTLVRDVAAFGPRVFLDLKLHDIPATVERAAANCAACGASMLTVHAAGGPAMLEAAAAGARSGATGEPPQIVAVTVLTSLDGAALRELGIEKTPEDLVSAWAGLARAKADGKRLRRHKVSNEKEDLIRTLRDGGKGIRAVAREAGVGIRVVQRVLADDG